MRVLVTGAEGYIGRALLAALHDPLGAGPEIVATDRGDGDIADPAHVERLFARPVDRVFHLAAIASGAAEAEPAAGHRVNRDATALLVRRCCVQAEAGGPPVRFVYASSIAVFGTPLPPRIDDATEPVPTLRYGIDKLASERLIDEASARGELCGRGLRLSGVVVRPALPNGARSAFNSDLIREPLAGRDVVCPVGPDATIWIASLAVTIANLLHLAELDAAALGGHRSMTAPVLAVSVADIVAAIGRVDPHASARVRFAPEAQVEAQFGRWPLDCSFERAEALGLACDASVDAVVNAYHHTLTAP